jgi:hypothetical protein
MWAGFVVSDNDSEKVRCVKNLTFEYNLDII